MPYLNIAHGWMHRQSLRPRYACYSVGQKAKSFILATVNMRISDEGAEAASQASAGHASPTETSAHEEEQSLAW